MEKGPRQIAERHVDRDERVLWAGAPDVDAAMAAFPRGLSPVAGAAILLGGGWFAARSVGVPLLDGLRMLWAQQPMALIVTGGIFMLPLILRVVKLDNRSRYRRHFENLTYAVTDRRLLVIEKDDVLGFEPEELNRPTVVARSEGFDDVIFATLPHHTSGDRKPRDPVHLERRKVGFKAIPDAEATRAFLERWIASELAETAASVAGFMETAASAAGLVETSADAAAAPALAGAGTRTVRGTEAGLTISCPDAWSVQVRRKKKPFGKTFLDMAKWQPMERPDGWNTVRIKGPHGCEVVAEVFETPPLADYDSMVNGRLAGLAGELLHANAAVEINGMHGFSVARRAPVQVSEKTGTAGVAAVATPFRTTVLHDGRRQLSIFSKWPEDSPELTAAVEAVVASVRLD